MAKIKVNLNDPEMLKDLLNETYLHASEQLKQAQDEINKLANSTALQDEPMDSKAKYAKAINDFMGIKDKAITQKMTIAKILAEVMNHKGNVNDAMSDIKAGAGLIDFKKSKEMVNEVNSSENKTTKTIELTKK